MGIIEIKTYKVTCDVCNFVTYIESQEKRKPTKHPKWKQIVYTKKGGGHYGLPYSQYILDVCSKCFLHEEFNTKDHVPEDAIDINLIG
jgi:hypothetical protein